MEWFLKIPRIHLNSWAPSATWENLLEIWSYAGVKGVIIPAGMSRTGEGLDSLASIIELAKRSGLQAWIIVPVLNSPYNEDLSKDARPKHRHGKQFEFPSWFAPICPSSHGIKGLVDDILPNSFLNLSFDALMLDYLRFPYFWEDWGNAVPESEWPPFCYCENCVNDFRTDTGYFLDFATPEQWQRWQCSVITNLLGQFHKKIKDMHPRLRLGLQVLPLVSKKNRMPRSEWVGQNLQSLQKYVDFFSPLLYANLLDWRQDAILNYLVEFRETEQVPVIPSFQISQTRWDRRTNGRPQDLNQLKLRLRPLGIEAATLFHARNLLGVNEIRSVLGE